MKVKYIRQLLLRTVSSVACVFLVTGAGMLSGCTVRETNTNKQNINVSAGLESNTTSVQENNEKKLMSDFKSLLESNSMIDSVVAYIDKNIADVSKENASTFITGLEEIQLKNLPGLEKKFYTSDMQNEFNTVYKPGFDLDNIKEIQNKELKDLLIETIETGYKVETAEGSYFPIINYEFYKKYSSYATDDMKNYIDIMAVESKSVPAKDAALIIGWDEIIDRSLAMEQFIKTYESSVKLDDIKKLQTKYLTFMLFGLNNTPLFSYDTKTINQEAKTIYLAAIKNNSDSKLIQTLSKFMDMLNESNYKLTDTVEKFRKEAVETK